MKRARILLTGAAGRIALQMRERLAPKCELLRLVDRVPFEALHPFETAHVVDLADPRALHPLLNGIDAIIHLAGYPREADWHTLIPANVQAVANVWDAAQDAGVTRILYASSNHAVGFYPRSQRIDESALPRPDSRYGVTKVFMEATARLYADKYGVRGFGMRIGHCSVKPVDARMLSHWIHPDDLAALIEVGLTADYQCEIVYGASANSRSWWNNSRAEALGYLPRHSADAFAAELADRVSTNAIEERHQGGSFAAEGYVRRVMSAER